jgi:DNA-binding HxlR family transcriptional regulator
MAVATVPRRRHSPRVQAGTELVGKRWTAAIVWYLLPGPVRFNALLTGIPGISDRVLTERLRELAYEGLVTRTVREGPPVEVTYGLTTWGRLLEPILQGLGDWQEDRTR